MTTARLTITPVAIHQCHGVYRTRFFVELHFAGEQGSHDIGNCSTEAEAVALRDRVVVVGKSWTLR